MGDKDAKAVKQETARTVTDEQIVTERKFRRRSFLTATGGIASRRRSGCLGYARFCAGRPAAGPGQEEGDK